MNFSFRLACWRLKKSRFTSRLETESFDVVVEKVFVRSRKSDDQCEGEIKRGACMRHAPRDGNTAYREADGLRTS